MLDAGCVGCGYWVLGAKKKIKKHYPVPVTQTQTASSLWEEFGE
jgi:hypothetical protein